MPRPQRGMAAADTIAAVATARGRAGIGIVRVSGPAVPVIAQRMLGCLPAARAAHFAAFRDAHGDPVDNGIAIFFQAPHSFTGEHVLEFQGHGGPAVLDLVLHSCLSLGARLAEPGEFALRAFLNEKLDLAQAEGVADLIDATSAQAARGALRSLRGEFSTAVHALDAEIVELRMFVEATIDFPEEDVAWLDAGRVDERIVALQRALQQLHGRAQQGVLLRDGVRLAIIGPPNVGKSSLLNRLAGEDRAIVSPVAGTTRDAIRESVVIQGIVFHITDTAGLRETEDVIEIEGIARAMSAAREADIVLIVSAADVAVPEPQIEDIRGSRLLRVQNKADLPSPVAPPGTQTLKVSAKSGEGLDALRSALLEAAGWRAGGEDVFSARRRHLYALEQAKIRLDAARQAYPALDLMAEELRQSHSHLGAITGRMDADALLGEIFSRFCIGK